MARQIRTVLGDPGFSVILLRNQGARRMYGYESSEVISQAGLLHTPEYVALGTPQERTSAESAKADAA